MISHDNNGETFLDSKNCQTFIMIVKTYFQLSAR